MSSAALETEETSSDEAPSPHSLNIRSPAEPSTSTALLGAKKSISTTKEDDVTQRPPRTPTPDQTKCAICLGDVVNKSYSNTCMHQFCFGCLLEWSKVKPECPLCKSQFRSIYHNIRDNADFDEYVVPTPIPHLSIRLTTSDRFSPEVMITSRHNLGNHDYSIPEFRIRSGTSSFSRAFVHPFMRDGALEASPNPFHADPPTFFGGALDLVHHHSSNSNARFSGYQSRRRRYDRNQWVSPFESTLQPGSVLFPSVEYFLRHPSAQRRIGPWLHRELSVLASLTHNRGQMGILFDTIMSLLLLYDIRSHDFRERIKGYLGPRTKHFQHEFYFFVVSGLRMEEFDRIAQYTSRPSSDARASEEAPRPSRPTVVTIDSDDDEPGNSRNRPRVRAGGGNTNMGNEIEIIISDDDDEPQHRANASARNTNSYDDLNVDDFMIDQYLNREFNLSENALRGHEESRRNQQSFPHDLPDTLDSLDDFYLDSENMFSNEVENGRSNGRYDPEMPVLEPQVDLNNLSTRNASGSGGGGSALTRNSCPHSSSTNGRTSAQTRSRVSHTLGLLQSLRNFCQNRATADSNDNVRRQRSGNRESTDSRTSASPYSYPVPHLNSPRSPQSNEAQSLATSAMRSSSEVDTVRQVLNSVPQPGESSHRSPDFETVSAVVPEDYRQRLRSGHRNVHSQNTTNDYRYSPVDCGSSTGFGTFRPLSRNTDNAYNSNMNSGTERSSCIHNSTTNNSIQVRIYPSNPSVISAMDLSTRGCDTSTSNRHNHHASVIKSRPRTPNRPPTPPEDLSNSNGNEQGECEYLGVHPIVKKPPLAVITLSSDDDDDNEQRCKNERVDNHRAEPVERDAFIDQWSRSDFGSELSMLPMENMVERHLEAVRAERANPTSVLSEDDMDAADSHYLSSSEVAGPSFPKTARTREPGVATSSSSHHQSTYGYFTHPSALSSSERTATTSDAVTANDNNDHSQRNHHHSSRSKKKRKKEEEKEESEHKDSKRKRSSTSKKTHKTATSPPDITISSTTEGETKKRKKHHGYQETSNLWATPTTASKTKVQTRSLSSTMDSSEDSSSAAEDEFGMAIQGGLSSSLASNSKRKAKSSKKKKSKKSRRSKSKSSKKEKEKVKDSTSKKIKSLSASKSAAASTSNEGNSQVNGTPKVRSTVLKICKSVKVKKAKPLPPTDDSDSSVDNGFLSGSKISKGEAESTIKKPNKLKSVVGHSSLSTSVGSSPVTPSSRDAAGVSSVRMLDFFHNIGSQRQSTTSPLVHSKTKSSRRWESAEEEEEIDNTVPDDSSDVSSLLTVDSGSRDDYGFKSHRLKDSNQNNGLNTSLISESHALLADVIDSSSTPTTGDEDALETSDLFRSSSPVIFSSVSCGCGCMPFWNTF